MHYLVAPHGGRLLAASGSFRQEDHGYWTDYCALHEVGEEIRLSNSNKDYLGVLRLIAPDEAALQGHFDAVRSDLRWELA
ncbi:hypothetical protein D3C80_1827400 [compost metagenome]